MPEDSENSYALAISIFCGLERWSHRTPLGRRDGVRRLEDFLRTLWRPPSAPAFEDFCIPVDGNKITIRAVSIERDAGMRHGRDGLEWCLQSALAEEFADRIATLVLSASGHQYLDARGNGIAVEVSTGEYPETFHPNR